MKRSVFFALVFWGAGLVFAQARPVAKSISAQAQENKEIKLEWEFPARTEPKILQVRIYRATRPYSATQDVESDIPIAEVDASERSYTDVLSAPGSYFYAVIAQTQKGPYKIVIPGMNATTNGARPQVQAASQEQAAQERRADVDVSKLSESQKELYFADSKMRNAPLPNPGTLLGFDRARTRMSRESRKSAAELGSKKTKEAVPIKSPYFFEEDMFSPEGGDEYTLFETLRAGLAPKKYEQSVALLQDFLSVHRSKETTERAIFYLGQSHYFCKDYKNAIRSFLSVQDAFPELSKKWIDSSLDLLVID